MKVQVERFIEEIYNNKLIGEVYKGYLKINSIRFDFELAMEIQEEDLVSIFEKKVDVNNVGRRIEFSIIKEGVKVDIGGIENYDMFCFFYGLITGFKSGSDIPCIPIGIVDKDAIKISPKIRKILNSPKFDCKIKSSIF